MEDKFLELHVEIAKQSHAKDVISEGRAKSYDHHVLPISEKGPEIISSKLTPLPRYLILKLINN
jgi:hypothetical protein